MEFLIAVFIAASLFLAIFPKSPFMAGLVIAALALYLLYKIYKEAYVPTRRIDPDHLDNLLDGDTTASGKRIFAEPLLAHLDSKVFGQEKGKHIIANKLALRSAMVGRERPIAVVLLVGGTGVGKTYIAEVVAEYVFGDAPSSLFTVDCASATDEYVNTLIGSPRGYAGSKENGELVSAINATDGNMMLLFDEYEKVASDSESRFSKLALSLFDEGRIQAANSGKHVFAYNTIIFLTSNIRADDIADAAERYTADELDKVVRTILLENYAPEFVGRLDAVVPLRPLNNRERAAVFEAEAEKLAKKYGLAIDESIGGIAEDIFVNAVRATQATKYGMRDLKRWVENSLGPCFVEAKDMGATTIRLEMVGEDFTAKALERELVT